MSMTVSHPPLSRRAVPRRAHGQNFGGLIRAARLDLGLPLEEIAPLAGLTVPEWEAIEAGKVPDLVEQIYLLVQALQLGNSWRPYLVKLFIGAWEL